MRFTTAEEGTMNRLRVLRHLVAEQPLHLEPCPLLAQQLNDLAVLLGMLASEVRAMKGHLKRLDSGGEG